jgi:hypothetical protein
MMFLMVSWKGQVPKKSKLPYQKELEKLGVSEK